MLKRDDTSAAKLLRFPRESERERWGIEECNLSEWSLTLLSETTDEHRVRRVERSAAVWNHDSRRYEVATLVISTDQDHDLPRDSDDKILTALLNLTEKKNGLREPRIQFTRYELMTELRIDRKSGRSYDLVNGALDRLAAVRLRSFGAWYHRSLGARIQGKGPRGHFGVLSYLTHGSGRSEVWYLVWDEMFFENLKARYIKTLDTAVYYGLRSPTQRQLLKVLDKHFVSQLKLSRKLEYTSPLRELWAARLGGSLTVRERIKGGADAESPQEREKFGSEIKRDLKPHLEAFKKKGIIKSYHYQLVSRGVYEVAITAGSYYTDKENRFGGVSASARGADDPVEESAAASNQEEPLEAPNPALVKLEGELVARGVGESQASDLVRLRPSREVEAALEEHDRKKAEGKLKSPAGWLYVRVKDGKAPDDYQTTTEKREKEAKKRALERERRRNEEESRRLFEERERRRNAEVDAALEMLEKQGRLESFLARATKECKNSILREPLKDWPNKRGTARAYLAVRPLLEELGLVLADLPSDGSKEGEEREQPEQPA